MVIRARFVRARLVLGRRVLLLLLQLAQLALRGNTLGQARKLCDDGGAAAVVANARAARGAELRSAAADGRRRRMHCTTVMRCGTARGKAWGALHTRVTSGLSAPSYIEPMGMATLLPPARS